MSNTDLADIASLGRQWRTLAEEVDFLGEIALSEDELKSTFTALSRCHLPSLFWTPDTTFVVTVAAVNFAYYMCASDWGCGGESGFVGPYMQQLCCEEKHWNERVGPAIGESIAEWARLPPRGPGGWRYVGPIREQAGLCQEQIPDFVEVLSRLRVDPGWRAVTSSRPYPIIRAVRRVFGTTYVENFLCRSAGLGLITKVCGLLTKHEDGDDMVASTYVYRHGFMQTIVRSLGVTSSGSGRRPRSGGLTLPKPEFVLDPQRRCLLLRFAPSDGWRCKVHMPEGGKRSVSGTIRIGEGLGLPFCDKYSGCLTRDGQDEPWTTPAWVPGGQSKWALFDERGPLLWCHDDGQPKVVPPGVYLLVIEKSLRRAGLNVLADHMYLDGMVVDYAVLTVDLDSGVDIPGLCVSTLSRHMPRLLPMAPQRCSRYAHVDALWASGHARVRIEHWDEAARQRYQPRYHIDGLGTSVNVDVPVGEGNTGDIFLEHLPVPCTGRFELYDMRPGKWQPPLPLTFAAVPPCRVEVPERLWADSERPDITVTTVNADDRVEFQPDAPNDATTIDSTQWHVREGLSQLDGVLVADGVRVPISIPLHRARLRMRRSAGERLILTPQSLLELKQLYGSTDRLVSESSALELSAFQSEVATLTFQSLEPNTAQIDVTTKPPKWNMPNHVVWPNEVSEVLDKPPATQVAVGRFVVRCGGRDVPTDTWYVDPEKLEPLLNTPGWLTGLPNPPDWLDWLMDDSTDGPSPFRLPSELEGIKTSRLRARRLQEDVQRAEARRLQEEEQRAEARRLREEQETEARHRQEELRSWAYWMKRASRTSRRVPDTMEFYRRSEVEGAAGHLRTANQLISTAIKQDCPDPFSWEYARVIQTLIYLRMGHIRYAFREIAPGPWQHFIGTGMQLQTIRELIVDNRFVPPAEGIESIGVLSPREDDRRLAAALMMNDMQPWIEAAEYSWLNAWLAWRWSVATSQPLTEQKAMLDQLKSLAKFFPGTQDCGERIENELRDERVRPWAL